MKKNSLLYQHACKSMLLILSMIFLTGALFAQDRQIRGKVVASENDSSVAGATIAVKGLKLSAMTSVSAGCPIINIF